METVVIILIVWFVFGTFLYAQRCVEDCFDRGQNFPVWKELSIVEIFFGIIFIPGFFGWLIIVGIKIIVSARFWRKRPFERTEERLEGSQSFGIPNLQNPPPPPEIPELHIDYSMIKLDYEKDGKGEFGSHARKVFNKLKELEGRIEKLERKTSNLAEPEIEDVNKNKEILI